MIDTLLPRNHSIEILLLLLALFSCVAKAGNESTSSPEPGTGLEGSISLHSISGGPVVQGVPDSRPLAETTFVVKQGELTVTSFTTNAEGHFRVSLLPGHYSISKKDWHSRVGFYGPFPVEITAGQFKKVLWKCETGMQ